MDSAHLNLFVLLVSYIIGISFFAYVTASISNFLDENLEDGKIFDFYGKWVRKEVWENNKRQEKIDYLKQCCQLPVTDEPSTAAQTFTTSDDVFYSAQNTVTIPEETHVPKWKKPLGACVYCANTWVNIILVTILTFSRIEGLPLEMWVINIIVASALSNTFLGKINK